MARNIDYGKLMHDAMRGLIQRVLEDVRDHGLPGAHHFFITFDTTHPGVRMADWLKQRYPSDMTVVMQHWFDDLEVDANGFGVTLNFGDSPEHLRIPYDAIETFVDPSVEFGLRFETHDAEDEDAQEDASGDTAPQEPENGTPRRGDADVVSLDKFRK